MTTDNNEQPNKPVTFKQLVMSILGAAFGVQNSKTQERDFQQSSPMAYIIGGIVFGVLFVLILMTIVQIVLS